MLNYLVLGALFVARSVGMFAFARALTSRELRILCYHGAALADEHRFRPGLFITGATFATRLRYLKRKRYPVLGLEEAVERLRAGTLPAAATVITIDDGWYGTYSVLAPLIEQLGFPATLYIASYYMTKGTQVFNVAASYAFWATKRTAVDLGALGVELRGQYDLADAGQRRAAEAAVVQWGERVEGAAARQDVLRALFGALGIDSRGLEDKRVFGFMTAAEASELRRRGVDIQLHTHRHRFPTARDDLADEIESNRRALADVTPEALVHLCYPSGEYTRAAFPWLEDLKVATATTTEWGLNTAATPLLELRRFLDSDVMPQIKFEAEVSGFLELARRALRRR